MVFVETILVEFGGDANDVIGVSAVFWDGVEEVEVGVLFVDERGDEGGVGVVFGAGLFIDAALDIVVKAVFDEVPVEGAESVDKVHHVDEIA